ncbi:MAG: hypothetical protein R6X07_09015, partial [Desulfatiglandales bacterium]
MGPWPEPIANPWLMALVLNFFAWDVAIEREYPLDLAWVHFAVIGIVDHHGGRNGARSETVACLGACA